MYLIDSHAHIYSDKFKGDLAVMLENCRKEGIHKICMPNIDHTSIERMLAIESEYPAMCFPMMGIHPSSIKEDYQKELSVVEEWLGKREFIAVGEIGLDLYWDKTFIEQQKDAFRIQINWAKKYQLPIVIHCRDAFEETISIVEEMMDDSLKGVFHCFTGTVEEALRIIDLGFYLGIGGVATFKNGGLDKVIPHLKPEHLLLETDSPYLSPAPYRGKRNEPAYINIIAHKVAELMGLSFEEVAKITTQNTEKLFKLPTNT